MEHIFNQDYIRAARAKGVKEWQVVWRHAFRNGLIPLITIVADKFPALLGGAIIVERIFSWPGIGRLAFDSCCSCDYPVIMGLCMMSGALVVSGQLLADIGLALVDPRIRAQK